MSNYYNVIYCLGFIKRSDSTYMCVYTRNLKADPNRKSKSSEYYSFCKPSLYTQHMKLSHRIDFLTYLYHTRKGDLIGYHV